MCLTNDVENLGKTLLNELVPFGEGGAFLPNSTGQLEIATSHRRDIRAGSLPMGGRADGV